MLKSALSRGGLTTHALNTLLAGENDVTNTDTSEHSYVLSDTSQNSAAVLKASRINNSASVSDNTETASDCLDLAQPRQLHRLHENGSIGYSLENTSEGGQTYVTNSNHRERIPMHDRRTIFITNLAERTTYKDIVGIIRGGRLLDIFLRRIDRSATVSFVEGAAEFLAYVKRNDIYLHTKRVCIACSEAAVKHEN